MNIFILDHNINKNVQYHVDKHVVKMITETCQILCTVYRETTENEIPEFIYKSTHVKHPCVIWCKESKSNWKWLISFGYALYYEYQYRYNQPTKHQKALKILDYLNNILIDLPEKLETPFAQAMPNEYKNKDIVKAYRDYYNGEKKHLFSWKNRQVPKWVMKGII